MQRFGQAEAGEGTTYERSVARLYRHILGRQPDAGGQRAFADLMQRNGADAVIDRIVNSNDDQQFGDWGFPFRAGAFLPPGEPYGESGRACQAVPLNQRRFRTMDAETTASSAATNGRAAASPLKPTTGTSDKDVLTVTGSTRPRARGDGRRRQSN